MGASDRAPTPGVLTTAVSDMQTAYTSAMGLLFSNIHLYMVSDICFVTLGRTNPNFVGLAAGK